METLKSFAKTNIAARIRSAAGRGALAHALIFSGDGDALTAAKYAACAMECTGTEKPCLSCAHCRKVSENIHPDVSFVRDEEHAEISVEIVREMRADAFIRPNEGVRKVYIFEDCARLNDKGQNVLLKVVEEGPPYAAFVFCAENVSSLLTTLRSRCTEIKLAPQQEGGEISEKAQEFCTALMLGTAERTAFFTALETSRTTREELGALLSEVRTLLANLLIALYGAASSGAASARAISSRLTKTQILGTIDLLDNYRKHCNYNVGVGPLLGGLAVELEEIL